MCCIFPAIFFVVAFYAMYVEGLPYIIKYINGCCVAKNTSIYFPHTIDDDNNSFLCYL